MGDVAALEPAVPNRFCAGRRRFIAHAHPQPEKESAGLGKIAVDLLT